MNEYRSDYSLSQSGLSDSTVYNELASDIIGIASRKHGKQITTAVNDLLALFDAKYSHLLSSLVTALEDAVESFQANDSEVVEKILGGLGRELHKPEIIVIAMAAFNGDLIRFGRWHKTVPSYFWPEVSINQKSLYLFKHQVELRNNCVKHSVVLEAALCLLLNELTDFESYSSGTRESRFVEFYKQTGELRLFTKLIKEAMQEPLGSELQLLLTQILKQLNTTEPVIRGDQSSDNLNCSKFNEESSFDPYAINKKKLIECEDFAQQLSLLKNSDSEICWALAFQLAKSLERKDYAEFNCSQAIIELAAKVVETKPLPVELFISESMLPELIMIDAVSHHSGNVSCITKLSLLEGIVSLNKNGKSYLALDLARRLKNYLPKLMESFKNELQSLVGVQEFSVLPDEKLSIADVKSGLNIIESQIFEVLSEYDVAVDSLVGAVVEDVFCKNRHPKVNSILKASFDQNSLQYLRVEFPLKNDQEHELFSRLWWFKCQLEGNRQSILDNLESLLEISFSAMDQLSENHPSIRLCHAIGVHQYPDEPEKMIGLLDCHISPEAVEQNMNYLFSSYDTSKHPDVLNLVKGERLKFQDEPNVHRLDDCSDLTYSVDQQSIKGLREYAIGYVTNREVWRKDLWEIQALSYKNNN